MRKAIVFVPTNDKETIGRQFPELPENSEFPPPPGAIHTHGCFAVKFYGDFLPESYECKEGERIQTATQDEIREWIGGVK